MSYKIIACHAKYTRMGTLSELTVLFDVNPLDNTYIDIRATRWSGERNEPGMGYLYLHDDEKLLCPELLQRVAGQCYQIESREMKKLFSSEIKETISLHKLYLKANPHLK